MGTTMLETGTRLDSFDQHFETVDEAGRRIGA
ncbi:hypothetical protein BH23GEM3_BH23GEM3_11530 [soil metagenome]